MIESSIEVATLQSDADAEDNSEDELDSADASGSEDLMAAFDQTAEERYHRPPLTRRRPPTPHSHTYRDAADPHQHAADHQQHTANATSGVPSRSSSAGGSIPFCAGVLSQTAQRSRRIDTAVDKASNEMTLDNSSEFSSTIVAMMFMMEERQAAHDAEYQPRKEEREREQAEREEKRAAEREMRE
ncbi:hypothetical protein PF010_g2737 [Phytophthora fragariae]|uniref:Uncharacterized protein n=1 Tax=Phytophthora fragariae TaxID=53985 RepID=A0A6G0LWI6_9STRA|nr:hypothetical protein PF010_g2737 [Phytophthora fragariae]